jgi:hypothetical protein
MQIYATLSSTGKRFRENYINKKIKIKRSQCLYMSLCMGYPYPSRGNGSLCIISGPQRTEECRFWWLYMKEFGLCEGPTLGYPIGI